MTKWHILKYSIRFFSIFHPKIFFWKNNILSSFQQFWKLIQLGLNLFRGLGFSDPLCFCAQGVVLNVLVHWWPLVLQLVQTVWKPDDHSELIKNGENFYTFLVASLRIFSNPQRNPGENLSASKMLPSLSIRCQHCWKKHVFGLWIFMSCCWYTRPFR